MDIPVQRAALATLLKRAGLGRRSALALAAFAAFGAASRRTKAASIRRFAPSSPRVIDVLAAGADPTGQSDSTSVFQNSLTSLENLGGGELIIPPGVYAVGSLSYGAVKGVANSLSVIGAGQDLSILQSSITHGYVLDISQPDSGSTTTIRDLGFATPNQYVGNGVRITGGGIGTGWQNVTIEDVDFSHSNPGGTFAISLNLASIGRSTVKGINVHIASNGAPLPSSVGVVLSGVSDVRFVECAIDGVGTAFSVIGYSEGLHISDTVVFGCLTGVSTGDASGTPYNGSVNLLGLYITGCEFQNTGSSLVLNFVYTGWLASNHFATSSATAATCQLSGSSKLKMNDCEITGGKNSAAVGISLTATNNNGVGCAYNTFSDCSFQYLASSLSFGPATQYGAVVSNTALGMLVQDASGNIISQSTIIDQSGPNSQNQAQWLTGLTGDARFAYLH